MGKKNSDNGNLSVIIMYLLSQCLLVVTGGLISMYVINEKLSLSFLKVKHVIGI